MWPDNALAGDTLSNRIDWSVAASLPAPGTAPEAASLGVAGAFTGWHNGALLIAGGADFPAGMPWEGGRKAYHDGIYVLKKSGSSYVWIQAVNPLLKQKTAYGASVSVAQGIVCIGGENEAGTSKEVFLMQWNEGRKQVDFKPLPALPVPLANAAAASLGNVVYVAGGEHAGKPSNGFFALDLSEAKPKWQTLPALPVAMSHSVAVVQSNGKASCVYVLGGRSATARGISDLHGTNFCYDPAKREWAQRAGISDGTTPTNLSAGTGVANGASYIVLLGGDKGDTFNRIETYNARIAAAQTDGEKQRLQAEKVALLQAHPGFSKDIYLYNTITDAWAKIGELPGAAQVTTTAVKAGEEILIPSGEVKPGVRTPVVTRGSVRSQSSFSWVDSVVLLVCFLLMTAGRFLFTGKTSNTDDYFKGGERIPQWAAGISIFGAKLSAITFMGIPAKTYATDWTYFFLLMTIIMVMPLVAGYFIPFYRRLNVTSAYEYLGKRFNTGSRMLASALYVLLQLGRMGIVVLLPSIALTLVTGIDINVCIIMIGAISIFFTVKGGIEAVIWVEVIQVLILAAGALFCLFYLPFQMDDWGAAKQVLVQSEKLKVFDFRFDFTEPTFWVVVIGGLAINLLTYGTDQTTVQRYLTTKSETESVRSLKLGAWLTLPSTLLFFSIGTLLFLFFREQPEKVNMALDNVDNIFPWYIVSQLPAGLSGLLIAGIFAAAMSSTEASMNSTATLLTTDFYQKLNPAVTPKQTLFFARAATLLLGIFVTCIALYMAHKGVSSLWDRFNTILGLFTGCIGGAFVLGIFTTKASGNGVMAGMALSCITQLLIQQYTNIHLLMYACTGLVSCVVFGYFLSLLMPVERDLSGLTIYK
ncbi:cyclically-permuted mutarotase family protein [Dyadobacter sp. BE34]|uniref:Cyclically-permuted mutarotase family protein n=1 Tax=Dyadobacter fermentans TaxID=94254 RepID=A0ABU1QUZ5_9BACT|nr:MULTISPECIES: sodium/solute symporter [Dyadobacter]MDR6804988.1 cyclically-permuted mutarotase family protein [Dyadobacter fermentans]MDR7043253.1 cyclically-permuted mutarotase family protein [Dyadobacter sp. BE242]MDR7197565.1 cyclically-permuted mutarotase family protein [Dyadobacter sp. BE34]MDR7215002.1 cyclically-permuted mutarotase family protein [Dyadobacter sp. BE31]MDR7262537.1 cyclically-permuted mutarotase family protein [Dyadobacter sp. BE32]